MRALAPYVDAELAEAYAPPQSPDGLSPSPRSPSGEVTPALGEAAPGSARTPARSRGGPLSGRSSPADAPPIAGEAAAGEAAAGEAAAGEAAAGDGMLLPPLATLSHTLPLLALPVVRPPPGAPPVPTPASAFLGSPALAALDARAARADSDGLGSALQRRLPRSAFSSPTAQRGRRKPASVGLAMGGGGGTRAAAEDSEHEVFASTAEAAAPASAAASPAPMRATDGHALTASSAAAPASSAPSSSSSSVAPAAAGGAAASGAVATEAAPPRPGVTWRQAAADVFWLARQRRALYHRAKVRPRRTRGLMPC